MNLGGGNFWGGNHFFVAWATGAEIFFELFECSVPGNKCFASVCDWRTLRFRSDFIEMGQFLGVSWNTWQVYPQNFPLAVGARDQLLSSLELPTKPVGSQWVSVPHQVLQFGTADEDQSCFQVGPIYGFFNTSRSEQEVFAHTRILLKSPILSALTHLGLAKRCFLVAFAESSKHWVDRCIHVSRSWVGRCTILRTCAQVIQHFRNLSIFFARATEIAADNELRKLWAQDHKKMFAACLVFT